jgi:hypothetical protein
MTKGNGRMLEIQQEALGNFGRGYGLVVRESTQSMSMTANSKI